MNEHFSNVITKNTVHSASERKCSIDDALRKMAHASNVCVELKYGAAVFFLPV